VFVRCRPLVVFCFALLAICPTISVAEADDARVAGRASAQALELRLVAPCCWNQTLEVHESEVASALRKEIRERLASGEPSEAIEDDFALRYGERIRAVPKGRDPRTTVPVLIGALMLFGALGLVALGRRWTRRSATTSRVEDAFERPVADDYDGELEDELQRL